MHQIGDLVARIREPDVYRVRVAEQVVQIAEDFLVRAGEKDAQQVLLAVAEFVEGQTGLT